MGRRLLARLLLEDCASFPLGLRRRLRLALRPLLDDCFQSFFVERRFHGQLRAARQLFFVEPLRGRRDGAELAQRGVGAKDLKHVLLTHVSYVLSVGLVQTAVYSCLPYLKDSGVLTQRQISRMLTVGTACFVVGKLSTAQILDLVGPKAAFIINMLIHIPRCYI